MWIIADEDKYVASTWGAVVRLTAGTPKEVGTELGILCLQNGCTEVKDGGKATKVEPVIEEAVEILDKVVEETTPSIDLEDMTKVQLEEHGRTLGIELDRRKKKLDLIAEIKTAQ
jgi:uncharacterized protein YuzE